MSDATVMELPLYAEARARLAFPGDIPTVAMSKLGTRYASRAIEECLEEEAVDLYYGDHYFRRDVLRVFEIDPKWYGGENSWEVKVFEAAYAQHWNYLAEVQDMKPFSPHYN